MKIKVGTRDSKLAIIQTEIVLDSIRKHYPQIELEIITMKTTGDVILNKTLDKIGGKGLFVKELDDALLNEKVDITVHSYKDMPMEINPNLPIVGISEREDPRDVLVLAKNKNEISGDLPIGCASKRRSIQIKKFYPHVEVKPIRGNVLTRLEKLDKGEYSAIVLAYAGLKRLNLLNRISRIFETDEIIPPACQGVICVQARKGFDSFFLDKFNNKDSLDTSTAERAFVKRLDGGCSSPVAGFGRIENNNLILKGMYVDKDNNIFIDSIKGDRANGEALGIELAERLLNRKNKKFG